VKAARRVTATLAIVAGMTLFGALPAAAGERTEVPNRFNATASTDGTVQPQAGWRFKSFHSTSLACNFEGSTLVAIGQAEDWTCRKEGGSTSWALYLYAWWF
jgi:hypothetical protein